MKGVRFITDDKNRKKAVVIDMATLQKFEEQVQDLLDGIIASARKNEPTVPWEEVKNKLKKKGKL